MLSVQHKQEALHEGKFTASASNGTRTMVWTQELARREICVQEGGSLYRPQGNNLKKCPT